MPGGGSSIPHRIQNGSIETSSTPRPISHEVPRRGVSDEHRSIRTLPKVCLANGWVQLRLFQRVTTWILVELNVWETNFIQEGQSHLSHHQKIKTMMPTPGRGWHSLWAQAQNRIHNSDCRKTSRKGPTEISVNLFLEEPTTGQSFSPGLQGYDFSNQ